MDPNGDRFCVIGAALCQCLSNTHGISRACFFSFSELLIGGALRRSLAPSGFGRLREGHLHGCIRNGEWGWRHDGHDSFVPFTFSFILLQSIFWVFLFLLCVIAFGLWTVVALIINGCRGV